MGKRRNKRRRAQKANAPLPVRRPEILPDDPPPPPPPQSNPDEAMIFAGLRPRPRLGSGAIALPEPDEEEAFEVVAPAMMKR